MGKEFDVMSYDRSDRTYRNFVLKFGKEDSEFGREVKVWARSSLEAGMIVDEKHLIPAGYVAHSLLDPSRARSRVRV